MFTPEQKQQLRTFCEVCDDIASCRFMREFFDQPHHISVGRLRDGTVKDEWPRYDDDHFRALLTHYRKLRMEGESKFERIVNLVKRVSDTNDREKLDYYKSEIKIEGQGLWAPAFEVENGNWVAFNQEQLEDLILNGDVFHSDPHKQHVLRKMRGDSSLMKLVAFSNYMRYLRTVIGYATETAAMIRERGYLD